MHSLTLGLLHSVYTGPDASKRMARDAATSYRTAEKWFAQITTPRADVLLRMASANEQLRAELVRRLGGHGYEDKTPESGGGVDASMGGSEAGTPGGLDRSAPGDLT